MCEAEVAAGGRPQRGTRLTRTGPVATRAGGDAGRWRRGPVVTRLGGGPGRSTVTALSRRPISGSTTLDQARASRAPSPSPGPGRPDPGRRDGAVFGDPPRNRDRRTD